MRVWLASLVLLASVSPAFAGDQHPYAGAPKPLTADTPSNAPAAKNKDPNAMPQEYVDLRRKVKGEFNAWMASDEQVKKDCAAARTQVEKLACDNKTRLSQKRLDGVHAMMRDMQKKIDTWRREKAGLPPPDWYPEDQKPTVQRNPDGSPVTTTGKDNTVLLPHSDTKLPANTF